MAADSKSFGPAQWLAISRALLAEGGTRIDGPNADNRDDWTRDLAPLLKSAGPAPKVAAPIAMDERAATQELIKQKAVLELRLASELDRIRKLEVDLKQQREDYDEAITSLSLQQKRLKELQDERTKLLTQLSELESKLRLQINETEQVQNQLEKVKTAQRAVGAVTTDQAQRLQTLEAENGDLRRRLEAALRERDEARSGQAVELAAIRARSFEGTAEELWQAMAAGSPDLFAPTHTPTRETLQRLLETTLDLARAMQVMEEECLHRIADLRFVADSTHPLNALYLTLHNRPRLCEVIRSFWIGRVEQQDMTTTARELHALIRSVMNGLYVAIVRSREMTADELNYRAWPAKGGIAQSEVAAIGQYFRDTASREIPDRLGTALRRLAGERAAQDFAELRKLIE